MLQKTYRHNQKLGSYPMKKIRLTFTPKWLNPPPPCKPVITEWKDYYKDVKLSNGGYCCTEDSTAVHAIAGTECIRILDHE